MIIPIRSGTTTIPVYIPQPTVSHTTQGSVQVSNEETQPKEITGLDIFLIIVVAVILISQIIWSIHFIRKFLK